MSSASTAEGLAAFLQTWKSAFVRVLEPLGAAGATIEDADGAALQPVGESQVGILTVKFSGG